MRLIILGLVLAAGAAWADTPSIPSSVAQPATEAPAPPPLSVWLTAAGGGMIHLQSGLVCPVELAGHRLRRAELFDHFGLDVGCDYGAPGSTITVYLTRRTAPATLEGAMDEARREFLAMGASRHPSLLSETVEADGDTSWRKAVYATDNHLRDGIWISDLHGWTFELRTTWREDLEAQGLADVKAITAKVAAEAGAHLALCARSKPPIRDGAGVKNAKDAADEAMSSSIIAGALLASAAQGEGNDHSDPPAKWCVEAPMERSGHDLLFWRSVEPDGSDARGDRITMMTQGAPPTLTLEPDSMADLIRNNGKPRDGGKAAAAPPARWIATLPSGDQTMIFGLFDGRPGPDAVADLFESILEGKAKALGGYGAKDKAIVISMPGS